MAQVLTFIAAMRREFYQGYSGLQEFAAALKGLSEADRKWFKERFKLEFDIDVVDKAV